MTKLREFEQVLMGYLYLSSEPPHQKSLGPQLLLFSLPSTFHSNRHGATDADEAHLTGPRRYQAPAATPSLSGYRTARGSYEIGQCWRELDPATVRLYIRLLLSHWAGVDVWPVSWEAAAVYVRTARFSFAAAIQCGTQGLEHSSLLGAQ